MGGAKLPENSNPEALYSAPTENNKYVLPPENITNQNTEDAQTPKKKSKKVLILLIVLVLLLTSAGGSLAYKQNYKYLIEKIKELLPKKSVDDNTEKPEQKQEEVKELSLEEIQDKMIEALSQVKYIESTGTIKISNKLNSPSVLERSFSEFDNISDLNNAKAKITWEYDSPQKIAFEIISIGNDGDYFKIISMEQKDASSDLIQKIKENWFQDEKRQGVGSGVSKAFFGSIYTKNIFIKLLSQKNVLNFKEKIVNEELATYNLKFELSSEESEKINNFKSFNGEILIDKNTFLPKKITVLQSIHNYSYSGDLKIKDEFASMTEDIEIYIDIKNYNNPVAINAPENFTTYTKIVNEYKKSQYIKFLYQDSDKDGLEDVLEEFYETKINSTDTDADGYKDVDELTSGYNPNGPGKLDILEIQNKFKELLDDISKSKINIEELKIKYSINEKETDPVKLQGYVKRILFSDELISSYIGTTD